MAQPERALGLLEVLRLLAAGAPNRAIAQQLVVTPETVKKHLSHLLGKLGVVNRTQAVARARELGLLPSAGTVACWYPVGGPPRVACPPEGSPCRSPFG